LPAHWTFGKRLAFGFALAALALLVVAIAGYRSTQTLIENNDWVSHSHRVEIKLEELMLAAADSETGTRGYVITGREEFLAPYEAANQDITRILGELRELVSDNPNQLRRIDALGPALDQRLAQLRTVIETRREKGVEAATALVSSGKGRQLMVEVRRLVGEIGADQAALMARRARAAEVATDTAEKVMVWGSLAGLLVVAFIGFYISRSLGAQVGAAVRRMESSSTELQTASNQQATGAREQATAMSEISTTITELLATSRQIAESAQRVSQIAEHTAAAVRAGDVTVRRGNDSMAGIRKHVEVIVSHMLELGKKSQQIGSVLDIVSELAEQTNILAINATIEAAGAGEAGKRFAVVADEIRKLADRVGGSTKEIRGLIDDVRSAVNTTVMTTETGSKAVEAGANQFGEVSTAFGQIASQVTITMEAAKEIGLSTKQQTTAVEQVNLAINNVAQATKESEVSTAQTLQTASELSGLSRELLRIVESEERTRARAA
jgi:methyl-accepting chemotaxis protein